MGENWEHLAGIAAPVCLPLAGSGTREDLELTQRQGSDPLHTE